MAIDVHLQVIPELTTSSQQAGPAQTEHRTSQESAKPAVSSQQRLKPAQVFVPIITSLGLFEFHRCNTKVIFSNKLSLTLRSLRAWFFYNQVGRNLEQHGPAIRSTVTLLSFAMPLQKSKISKPVLTFLATSLGEQTQESDKWRGS